MSDGSSILGIGNLGAAPALPAVEGKAVIFKELADIDAVPLVLDTQEPEEIIHTIKAIAPSFGGISLEGFSAPKCYEIERRLKAELDVPVMHDSKYGIAISVLASLINSVKVVKKKFSSLKVVIVGAGVAGQEIARIINFTGVGEVVVVDSKGIIYKGRPGLERSKKNLPETTNSNLLSGDVMTALDGADVLIGVSVPGIIAQAHIEQMSHQPIVFALANPLPEIMPVDAKRAGAAIVATSQPDFPNQIDNGVVFPGIFRGALDNGIREVTDDMKISIAKKIASLTKKPTAENIIVSVFTPRLTKIISGVIKNLKPK